MYDNVAEARPLGPQVRVTLHSYRPSGVLSTYCRKLLKSYINGHLIKCYHARRKVVQDNNDGGSDASSESRGSEEDLECVNVLRDEDYYPSLTEGEDKYKVETFYILTTSIYIN